MLSVGRGHHDHLVFTSVVLVQDRVARKISMENQIDPQFKLFHCFV